MYETECRYFGVWKDYYYVQVLEVVTYVYFTACDIDFMDFEFEKNGKCNFFGWKYIMLKVLLLLN